MGIIWRIHPFNELQPALIHAMYKLRVDVFVVEQNCPYPEVDAYDLTATHVLGMLQGELVAYARIIPPGQDGLPHVGRVIVRADRRGEGLAHELMNTVIAELERVYRSARSALAAQSHLQCFYEMHAYSRTGAPYDLDGIPHVDMVRNR